MSRIQVISALRLLLVVVLLALTQMLELEVEGDEPASESNAPKEMRQPEEYHDLSTSWSSL